MVALEAIVLTIQNHIDLLDTKKGKMPSPQESGYFGTGSPLSCKQRWLVLLKIDDLNFITGVIPMW